MSFVPVVFEDHLVERFRPLAWSTPLFEIRCGMFNTRERVGLCSPSGPGFLLGRRLLDPLHCAKGWGVGVAALEAAVGPDSPRFLFLSGRLAPNAAVLDGLFGLPGSTDDFLWTDQVGLVAALLTGERALAAARQWAHWESEMAGQGAWSQVGVGVGLWPQAILFPEFLSQSLTANHVLACSSGPAPEPLEKAIRALVPLQEKAPTWIWEIVSSTAEAMLADLSLVKRSQSYRREPFGIFPAPGTTPVWGLPTSLSAKRDLAPGVIVDDAQALFLGPDVNLSPGTFINTAAGPVVIDRGVRVMPHCFLEGPLYLGPGSLVKPGSRIHGESSFGVVNRIAGEIGESTFGDFANKQHEGFIGHAVLGSWVNLGAMTTCSDLKNNYGDIRVDLGGGPVSSGQRFIGLLLGDHAKTAIGSLFNTGTCVGFASNIFGDAMPPKFVPNFSWGGEPGAASYQVARALETAAVVMARRECTLTDGHRELFSALS